MLFKNLSFESTLKKYFQPPFVLEDIAINCENIKIRKSIRKSMDLINMRSPFFPGD